MPFRACLGNTDVRRLPVRRPVLHDIGLRNAHFFQLHDQLRQALHRHRRGRVYRRGGPCADVDGDPDVAAFDYNIELIDGCEESLLGGGFDMNSDDSLTPADLGAWASAPADLNRDGNVTSQDLELLSYVVSEYTP